MKKYGFWFCLLRTAKLKLYYATIRFDRANGSCKGYKFTFDIADTLPKRRLGLSFREDLGGHEGMVLAYPKFDYHRIWMMNMRLNIDILWLDEHKNIVYIVQNAQRSYSWSDFAKYNPTHKSKYVVELLHGTVKQHKFVVGNKINFQIYGNPS